MRLKQILNLTVVATTGCAVALSAEAQDWTPEEITTSLWLDAADASTITLNGSTVSQWDDKSGNNRDATQGTVTSQGSYILNAQDGNNIVRFDGVNDFMNFGTGLNFLAGGNGNATHTTFAVLLNSNYSNLYGAATANGTNEARLHVGFRDASSYRQNRWSNDYYAPLTANFDQGEYNLVQWTWVEGGAKSVHANTLLEGSGGTGSSLDAMSGGGRLINVVENANQGILQADLGEFIIIQGTPTDDEVDLIEGYLAWKWGLEAKLPGDHAYASGAPQIPEPSSLALLGGLGLLCLRRRRR